MAHLEMNGHHGLGLACRKVHLTNAAGACTHVARSEVGGYLFGDGIFARKLLVEPEIDKLLAAVECHIALAAHLDGYGAADALVGRLFLQLAGLGIGKEAFQIHFHDFHSRAVAFLVLGLTHVVEIHRLAGHAEHTRETSLGNLYDGARLFVDGHGLALHAVGTKDHPLPVGCPLVVGLIDF